MVRDRGTPLAMPVVWDERHRRHDVGGGIWLGVLLRRASKHSLLPANDPRLPESLAFENL